MLKDLYKTMEATSKENQKKMTFQNDDQPKKGASKVSVPPEQRIGSKRNYIVLRNRTAKRPLLEKWMPEILHTADFSRHKRTGNEDQHYLLNLLSVPELSPDTLRLGLFLFSHLLSKSFADEDGDILYDDTIVFSLNTKDVVSSKFGENGFVYIGRPRENSKTFSMPFKSLPYLLRANRVRMSSFDLEPMLQTLHDYGFLTVTPLSRAHCKNQDFDDYHTNCFHVALNTGAIDARINRKWNDTPTEPKN